MNRHLVFRPGIKSGALFLSFAIAAALLSFTMSASLAQAEPMLKPFLLTSKGPGELKAKVEEARSALTGGGFEVVGEYAPYDGSVILVVTHPILKRAASWSDAGGYGAVQRVSITRVDDTVQVSYTNPVYMAAAYRMISDLESVAEALSVALGKGTPFGSEDGLSADDLREYHYMLGMEYFDEPSTLASYGSHQEALAKVEEGLSAAKGGVTKVYRVDIPDKEETVFGVALTHECSGDEYIMKRIDFRPLKSTAHLPYEILVSGNKVYALYARFRIAINFPDLSMMGDNSFFSIMCAPDEIEEALEKAGGKE